MTSRRTRLPSGTAARLSSCAGGASAGMMVSGAFIGSARGAAGGLSLLRGRRAVVEQRLAAVADDRERSEEHTSELQSLMRISYAVFCLKKKTHTRRLASHIK